MAGQFPGYEGSSPRMRGTLKQAFHCVVVSGIIPADAGNTQAAARNCRYCPDHPRGCGEHVSRHMSETARDGSSPRMRGTRYARCPTELYQRIIPADAGNTGIHELDDEIGEDHPRGCGEHAFRLGALAGDLGSSPRMRGTLPATLTHCQPGGIIPADAGNTSLRVMDVPAW